MNYPSCTTKAAGNCLDGNINPPECTTAPNRAPSPPALNVPSSVEANTAFEARFTEPDPDDDTLRYGFDATAEGIVDTWYPATGTVGSGSTETRPWRLHAGTFTFQVLAQDSKGMNSAWTQHTITVTPPACPALGAQETRALNASQLESRVLRGENVKVFPGAAGTSVLVSRGGRAEVASSYSGTALYLEGPVAEYGLSSGGNTLSLVDRCGGTTRAAVQGALTVTFYFADGSFSAEIQSGPTWHLVLGTAHLYLDAQTEDLSAVQATVKANLRPGGSQGRC